MSVSVQIRDVPEETRDAIAQRAADRGQSMQSYLLELLNREAAMVNNRNVLSRIRALGIHLPEGAPDPVDVIRQGRAGGFEVDRG